MASMASETDAEAGLETLMASIKILEETKGPEHVKIVLSRLLSKYGTSNTMQPFASTYEEGKELGSGAYSVVKVGTHKVTGNKVAVKIVAKKKLSRGDFDGIEMECKLLREMHHPHIIKCYETFDEDHTYYIITELVEGGDLFDRIISKSTYNEKEARDLIKLFLETMAYMHDAHGVVHRDLKPENILLTSKADNADIKVADFGFAKKVAEMKDKEPPCGTPGYVSPEVIRGDPYGCEADIWSMGVICYVLLAGYPPFYEDPRGPNYPHKLYRDIRQGKYYFHPERWGSISPEAIDMLKKMMCVNQQERWTAAQLLEHPWIKMGSDVLLRKDLSAAVVSLKKYRAKLQFRKAANTVIAVRRLLHTSGKSEDESPSASNRQYSEDDHLIPPATTTALATEGGEGAEPVQNLLPVGVGVRLQSTRRHDSVHSDHFEDMGRHAHLDEEKEEENPQPPHDWL